jgi:hypothetical protein
VSQRTYTTTVVFVVSTRKGCPVSVSNVGQISVICNLGTSAAPNDFGTLNQCLDDAMASAVTEYSRRAGLGTPADQPLTAQDLVETAVSGFEALQTGTIAVGGATGALVYRTLKALRAVASSTAKPDR